MQALLLSAAVVLQAHAAAAPPAAAQAFEQLKALAGDWQAELPGYGIIGNTIRVVSGGMAVEETIGTPEHNEVSLYTRDGRRLLLTHFCALTPDGHIARLETSRLQSPAAVLRFIFFGATNLHSGAAPHMRLMAMSLGDRDHFEERWTKVENGKDTVFDFHFARRQAQG